MPKKISFFGKQKENIWKKLSEEIGAEYIPAKRGKASEKIIAKHENWTIIIDTYLTSHYGTKGTKITAPYVNRDSFYFRIYRGNVVSRFSTRLGLQDIIIGHKQFDHDFIIQGNDERKLKVLFDNDVIRKIISWQPYIHLSSKVDDEWVIDEWREGISELVFITPSLIMDKDRLRDLYELFAELLNHLCHMGSAYEDDPSYK
ncbi:MAG: DUF3137 domain-containing protein [Bacteroidota bacterium]